MPSSTPIDFDSVQEDPARKVALPTKKRVIRWELPPIDVRLLTEQCLGNLAFGVSMLEAFQTTAQERIDNLENHVRQGNFTAVGELALSLKGVVGVLGAEILLDLSTQLQAAAEGRKAVRVRELAPRIAYEMQRVLDEIPKLRAGLGHDI